MTSQSLSRVQKDLELYSGCGGDGGLCGCVWWQAGCRCGWHRKSKICRLGAAVGGKEIEQELSVPGDSRGVLLGLALSSAF